MSTQLDQIAKLSRECNLGSPLREIRSAGSARGDGLKKFTSRPVPTHHSIVRKQLMEMIEKRVRDGSVLRLIRKWIQVGVIEEGRLLVSDTGTGQGQTISPLLANVYLHYVLDEWFEKVVKPRLRGEAHEIRFADDAILCFQYREDAEKVKNVLAKRFARYGLTLHPEKTRLVEFGREAIRKAKRQGKKPGTFDFLGFTHISVRSRRGKFTVYVRTMRKRLRRGLKAVDQWCRVHRHDPVDAQQNALNAKLRGHYQYYGRPTNYRGIGKFYRKVRCLWRTWLSRRTRGAKMTWEKYESLLRQLPCCHPESCIPGLRRESGLRNPLRAICTVGSVREEKSWRSR